MSLSIVANQQRLEIMYSNTEFARLKIVVADIHVLTFSPGIGLIKSSLPQILAISYNCIPKIDRSA